MLTGPEQDHDWRPGSNSRKGKSFWFARRVRNGEPEYFWTPTGRLKTWKTIEAARRYLRSTVASDHIPRGRFFGDTA